RVGYAVPSLDGRFRLGARVASIEVYEGLEVVHGAPGLCAHHPDFPDREPRGRERIVLAPVGEHPMAPGEPDAHSHRLLRELDGRRGRRVLCEREVPQEADDSRHHHCAHRLATHMTPSCVEQRLCSPAPVPWHTTPRLVASRRLFCSPRLYGLRLSPAPWMHRTVSLAKSSFGDHRVDSHAPRRRPGHHVP